VNITNLFPLTCLLGTCFLFCQVLDAGDANVGYNAATGVYEDLLAAGIIDPAKVIRCCLENAASVAKTFLMSDVVVTEIPQAAEAAPADMGMGGY
jgi:chaperonin GroEL